MNFQAVFEPSPDGGFTVYVPSLPGCISEGDTLEEARANIREAIELYLEPTAPSEDLVAGAVVEWISVHAESPGV